MGPGQAVCECHCELGGVGTLRANKQMSEPSSPPACGTMGLLALCDCATPDLHFKQAILFPSCTACDTSVLPLTFCFRVFLILQAAVSLALEMVNLCCCGSCGSVSVNRQPQARSPVEFMLREFLLSTKYHLLIFLALKVFAFFPIGQ